MREKCLAMLLAVLLAVNLLPVTARASSVEEPTETPAEELAEDLTGDPAGEPSEDPSDDPSEDPEEPEEPVPEPGFDNFSRSKLYEGSFGDVDPSAWYYDNVATAYEYGLMVGVDDTAFAPDSDVTLVEVLVLVSRVLSIYSADNYNFDLASWSPWWSWSSWYTSSLYADGAIPEWSQPYVDYALKHNLVTYGQFSDYNVPATRADFVQIFSALPDDILEPTNSVDEGSIPDVPFGSKYEEAAYRLYRAGIMIGSDEQGSLRPNNNIARREVAALVSRAAIPSMRMSLTLTSVPLYADSGREIRVAPVKVNSYLSLGWRTEPFTLPATSDAKELLNSATLLPMITGYDKLDNLVDEIFAQIFTEDMSVYEKVQACHVYLINNLVYKGNDAAADALFADTYYEARYSGYGEYVSDAYAVLVSGSGGCTDYSSAFMVMTRRIGLECYIFEGACRSFKGGYDFHRWNVITMRGVDYTFDSEVEDKNTTNGNVRYRYFCKTFEEMNTRDGDRGAFFIDYNAERSKAEFPYYGLIPTV